MALKFQIIIRILKINNINKELRLKQMNRLILNKIKLIIKLYLFRIALRNH